MAINPLATLVDVTHLIKPYSIVEAAMTIGSSFSVFPAGTIHLSVVDPGVGSSRRPIVVVTEDYYFVGPDNGIFSYIYTQRAGGLEVYHITASEYLRNPSGRTFHGRDIFAPLAAHLSTDLMPQRLGPRIDDFVVLDIPTPVIDNILKIIKGQVIYIDHFGNCITNIDEKSISSILHGIDNKDLHIVFRDREIPFKCCYQEAESQQLCVLLNSSGSLELFVNQGSASKLFDITVGQRIEIFIPR